MKKVSFFLKIFIGYFSLVLLFFLIIFFTSYKIVKDKYIDTLSHNLKNVNKSLEFNIFSLVKDKKYNDIDKFVKKLGNKMNIRITVIATNGAVLGDSKKNPKNMENYKLRPEIRKALNGIIANSIRFSRTMRRKMLYVASPIKADNKVIGVVRTSLYFKDIEATMSDLKVKILQIVFYSLLITLFVSAFIAHSLSFPIRDIVDFVRKIASGKFGERMFYKRNDEIGELADSLNYMSGELKKTFSELNSEKEELNKIIDSMKEGLIVIDQFSNKILIANNRFKEIVKQNDIIGRYYWEVLRNNELENAINEALMKKSNLSKVIKILENVYLCSISLLSDNRVIILFYDITEKREIEKIKKDFVGNVSHELKTPLTAIKGFVETLMSTEKDKTKKHYLEVINNHTERMINIINDLLSLSELENYGKFMEKEEVNIVELARSVVKIFENKLNEKGLYLNIETSEDTIIVYGNKYKLEEMFINLIDNSIKYTEKGGINISIRKEGEFLKISVQDTGIGIPKKDIPRIFERFYVVDKSRSRKMGGTGLGLSIVKHIVMNHNGKIEVESEINKGTTFIITMPIEVTYG